MAVGVRGQRPAAAGRRQHPGAGAGDRGQRREQQVGGADHRHVALVAAQRRECELHRDQGRRAGGVDGERRPVQAEPVRHPGRAAAGRAAEGRVRRDGVQRGAAAQSGVVVLDGADRGPHADAVAGAPGPVQLRVGQRLVGDGQQQALLRIELDGLLGADAEPCGVEEVDSVEVPAPAQLPGPRGEFVVRRVPARPPGGVARHPFRGRQHVLAGPEHVPVGGGPVEPAGQAAADAQDRRALGVRGALPGQGEDELLLAEGLQVGHVLPHRVSPRPRAARRVPRRPARRRARRRPAPRPPAPSPPRAAPARAPSAPAPSGSRRRSTR